MSGKPKSTAVRSKRPKILVIGLGNFLLRDDGVGIHAVRRFQQLTPRPCQAVEIGTAVFHAVPLLERADRVLAFDAIEADCRPGSVYLLRSEDVGLEDKYDSLHEMGLPKVLQTLRRTPTEVVIVGAEPQTIEWGTDLSPALDAAANLMVATAQKVIAAWQKPDAEEQQLDFAKMFHNSRFEIRDSK